MGRGGQRRYHHYVLEQYGTNKHTYTYAHAHNVFLIMFVGFTTTKTAKNIYMHIYLHPTDESLLIEQIEQVCTL